MTTLERVAADLLKHIEAGNLKPRWFLPFTTTVELDDVITTGWAELAKRNGGKDAHK